MTLDPIGGDSIPYENGNDLLTVGWNGCTWQFIDDGLFLRNGSLNKVDVSDSVPENDPC